MTSRRHNIHLRTILVGIFCCLANNTMAGQESNGGYIVDSGQKHVDFFDLWYSKEELSFKIPSRSGNHLELAKDAVQKLIEMDPKYFDGLLVAYSKIINSPKKLRSGLNIVHPSTFLGNIRPDDFSNISFLPLAVYTDSGVLLKVESLWKRLEQNPKAHVHEAAFFIHESLGDMFRAKARKDRHGLSDDKRREIARDTVIIVAHVFSDLSVAELKTWFSDYLETGKAYHKPDPKEIVIEERLVKHLEVGESHAVVLEHLCRNWKKGIDQRLAGKTIIHVLECKRSYKSWRDRFVVATGLIRAVPSGEVIEINETLHSDLLGLGAPNTLFSDGMRDDFEKWQNEVETKLGDRLFFRPHNFESVKYQVKRSRLERPYYWHQGGSFSWAKGGLVGIDMPGPVDSSSFGRYTTSIIYKYRGIGVFFKLPVKLYIFLDKTEAKLIHSKITGTAYTFHAPQNQKTEREAAKLGFISWKEKCEESLEESYENNAIYATCKEPKYRVDERKSENSFFSYGLVLKSN